MRQKTAMMKVLRSIGRRPPFRSVLYWANTEGKEVFCLAQVFTRNLHTGLTNRRKLHASGELATPYFRERPCRGMSAYPYMSHSRGPTGQGVPPEGLGISPGFIGKTR
jgi:hypothetical protein